MCGEQPYSMPLRYFLAGSPPRVRGTAGSGSVLALGLRITPARAGNSSTTRRCSPGRWDHPRACGEQAEAAANAPKVLGSPPRVRGTAFLYLLIPCLLGITPAREGNSRRQRRWSSREKDHPRACGEQRPSRLLFGTMPGSPPRVRGTVCTRQLQKRRIDITPARAGNSIAGRFIQKCIRDHPRACGEQSYVHMYGSTNRGSPPRVRGTVQYF